MRLKSTATWELPAKFWGDQMTNECIELRLNSAPICHSSRGIRLLIRLQSRFGKFTSVSAGCIAAMIAPMGIHKAGAESVYTRGIWYDTASIAPEFFKHDLEINKLLN